MNWALMSVVLCLVLVAAIDFWATVSLRKKINQLEEQIAALNRGLPPDLQQLKEHVKALEYQQQPLRDW